MIQKDDIKLGFNIVLSIMGVLALIIFNDIKEAVEKLESNISALNTKMAVVVTENETMKNKTKDHELRIRALEKN